RALWGGIAALPIFGGVLVGATLVGTPRPGSLLPGWAATLLVAAFVWFLGWLLARRRLRELNRRGVWVPPGTVTRPAWAAAGVAAVMVAFGTLLVFSVGYATQ
ncbi:MAG: hypothetical protein ACRCZF_23530, partial [Gemmataceae bacterium]